MAPSWKDSKIFPSICNLHLTKKMVPVSSTFVRAVILAESSTSHFRMTRLLFLPCLWTCIFAVLGNARLREWPLWDRMTNGAGSDFEGKGHYDLACSFPDGSPHRRWTNEPPPPPPQLQPQTHNVRLRSPQFVAAVSIESGMGTLEKWLVWRYVKTRNTPSMKTSQEVWSAFVRAV